MILLKTIARRIGLDGAIAYSSAARVIQAIANLLTVVFIATLLSPEEQGYYYTFASVIGIQVFFELGFTGIITQYVAHEVVHLSLNSSNEYEGEVKHLSRLNYLMHFCVKWYTVITILFCIVVNIIGIVFFTKFGDSSQIVDWKTPWILLSVATSLKLFQSPFTSLIIGLGKVKEMNKVLFYQQLFISLSMWFFLFCGFKLYVLGLSSLIGVIVWFIYIIRTPLFKILLNIWRNHITFKISYMKEIFPYQWRIALSWISGYFIFQLFNPVLFAAEGVIVAGQMGMTISVLNGIQALALSWQNTKIPIYSGLIELKKYGELDSLFGITTKQMLGISLTLTLIVILLVVGMDLLRINIAGKILSERFLKIPAFVIMSVSIFLNQLIYSWATYLRCHKKEPFLILSIVGGLLCMLSTIILGKYFGLYGIVIGYFVIVVIQVVWAKYIFNNKKIEWHYEY